MTDNQNPGVVPNFPTQPTGGVPGAQPQQDAAVRAVDIDFDTDVKFRELERMPQFKKGEAAFISFISWHDDQGILQAPPIKMAETYYLDPSKGVPDRLTVRAPDQEKQPDLHKRFVERWGEPKPYFGAVVFKYHTDINGNFPSQEQLSGKCYAWRFGSDKWKALQEIHRTWGGIQNIDLKIICEDDRFQRLQISAAPNHYRTLFGEQDVKDMEVAAQSMYGKLDVVLGRKCTTQEYMSLLAGQSIMNAGVAQAPGGVSPFGGQAGQQHLPPQQVQPQPQPQPQVQPQPQLAAQPAQVADSLAQQTAGQPPAAEQTAPDPAQPDPAPGTTPPPGSIKLDV